MTTDWKAQEAKYYMHVVNRQPVVIQRGEGARVWDVDGKEYLDFTAGWAVVNLGHAHPAVTKAIQEQAAMLLQTSNQFYTTPQLELAEALVENSSLDKVFFCNSGAEANEGAVKLARKYGRLNRNGGQEIITVLNSFHGRTLAMAAATGQPAYQEKWAPLTPGFVNVPYDDLDAVKGATNASTCAVMVEVLQGEGGVNVPTEGYLKGLREWCDANGILLIFDEIQTGMGRLGTLWGHQAFEVEPDGRQRWFSLEEINELRRRLKINRKSLMPTRPAGKRAVRAAVARVELTLQAVLETSRATARIVKALALGELAPIKPHHFLPPCRSCRFYLFGPIELLVR